MAEFLSIFYQFGTNAAFLLLSALGLIVILGMMNIINLAHGEFMMMGAYVAAIATHAGIPFPIAVILAFIFVGIVGVVIERLIVRHFYGRELSALVVTWGISLILAQGALLIFGPSMSPIGIPKGVVSAAGYSFSVYWLVLIGISIMLPAGLALLYLKTSFGLDARATMQNAHVARSLGIRVSRIYMLTFGLGSALAGLAGALLAPTTTIAPFMGQQFVAPAFITVVVGGAGNVISGTVGASALLSGIKTPVSILLGSFYGAIALLFAALVMMRFVPNGVSSLLRRRSGATR